MNTNEEFKNIRKMLGLTKRRLAIDLGRSEAMINYYESGWVNKAQGKRCIVPKSIIELMRFRLKEEGNNGSIKKGSFSNTGKDKVE